MCRFICSLSLAAILAASCGGTSTGPASGPNTAIGQTVQFALPSDTGTLVAVPVSGARATIVEAFGPTCEPCSRKLPPLVLRRRALAENGVNLVLVAVLADRESTQDASRALADWGVASPFLVDRGDSVAKTLDIRALPGSVILDKEGKVRWAAGPATTVDDIVRMAEAVAGE
ncbi:MAG: TlpA disulfide reductase family protein [Polyangiaceae bacterium]